MKKEKQQIFLAVAGTFVVTSIVATMIHCSIVREMDESFQFELDMRREEIAELEMLVNGVTDESGVKRFDPVVAYSAPGKFTEIEKAGIQKNLVEPLVDYYLMHDDQPLVYSVLIEKAGANSNFLYGVDVLTRGDGVTYSKNGLHGFLYGKKGKALPMWKPGCMEECELSDAYLAKYPDALK